MSTFFWSKRKTVGFVVPAKTGRRARPSIWRYSLLGLVAITTLLVVLTIGVGKRGLAQILSGGQSDKKRVLLIGHLTSDSAVTMGIATIDSAHNSLIWLPDLPDLISTTASQLSWPAKVGQLLSLPVTDVFEFKTTATTLWAKDLDAQFWSALSLPSQDRALYYQLWHTSRDLASESLEATTTSELRKKFDLPPLLTAFNRDCPVMVINATDMTGLGNRYSSLLEKEGLRVVRLDSDPQSMTKTQVVVDASSQDLCADTAQIIQGIFSTDQIQIKSQLSDNYRATIVVFLGEDSQFLVE